MKSYLPFIVALMLLVQIGYSQKEANNWYFGDHAGVDFNSGSPVALTNGSLNTLEGCATISDATGSLLFYTDGSTVWDKTHGLMSNGLGLFGHSSSSQSGVIVPKPGSTNIYYVFTVPLISHWQNGLHYSIVDMNLNGGLGAVTTKNTLVVSDIVEKISAINHKNNQDVWIVCHKRNSNQFNAFSVTASGVSTVPVITNLGQVHSGVGRGYLKSSHDGSSIATTFANTGFLEIFDFDNQTGMLSNNFGQSVPNAYGIEFSPSLQYLYVSSWYSGKKLYQYDLLAGTNAQVLSSRQTIYTLGNSSFFGFGALQLGPDNKIYLTHEGRDYLHVIDNPDLGGLLCDFQLDAVHLGGKKGKLGFPTFIQSYFSITVDVDGQCSGDSTYFNINQGDVYFAAWNFDDSLSGPNNINTGISVAHMFSDTGLYNVEVVSFFTSGLVDTNYIEVYIGTTPTVDLGSDTTFCQGTLFSLNASATNANYNWSTGSTNNSISISNSGTYWVNVFHNGCENSDTIDVTFNPYPVLDLGPDSTLCDFDTLFFDISTANGVYLWNDGSTLSTNYTYSTNTMVATVTELGCSTTDTINVQFNTLFDLNLGLDTIICDGDSIILSTTTNNLLYSWNNGSTNSSITVNQPGMYIVTAISGNCVNSDSIIISTKPYPVVSIGNDTTICSNATIVLDAYSFNASYLWSNNSTNNSVQVNQQGNYSVQVDLSGCIGYDEINIYTNATPIVDLGLDTVLCEGINYTLQSPTTNATYLWSNATTQASMVAQQSGTYWLIVTNNGCRESDSINLTFNPIPMVNLGPDLELCEGETLILNVQNNNSTYLWHDNSTSSSYTVYQAGTYYVQVESLGCTNSDIINISYLAKPKIDLGDDLVLCLSEKTTLNLPKGLYTYLWNDGSQLNYLDIFSEGIYSVQASNRCGSYEDLIIVESENCNCQLYIPNAFTPNNDGNNDVFLPVFDFSDCQLLNYELNIYNRTGNLVFVSNTIKMGWNGTYKNQAVPSGTYIYTINSKILNKIKLEYGSITLIR